MHDKAGSELHPRALLSRVQQLRMQRFGGCCHTWAFKGSDGDVWTPILCFCVHRSLDTIIFCRDGVVVQMELREKGRGSYRSR